MLLKSSEYFLKLRYLQCMLFADSYFVCFFSFCAVCHISFMNFQLCRLWFESFLVLSRSCLDKRHALSAALMHDTNPKAFQYQFCSTYKHLCRCKQVGSSMTVLPFWYSSFNLDLMVHVCIIVYLKWVQPLTFVLMLPFPSFSFITSPTLSSSPFLPFFPGATVLDI